MRRQFFILTLLVVFLVLFPSSTGFAAGVESVAGLERDPYDDYDGTTIAGQEVSCSLGDYTNSLPPSGWETHGGVAWAKTNYGSNKVYVEARENTHGSGSQAYAISSWSDVWTVYGPEGYGTLELHFIARGDLDTPANSFLGEGASFYFPGIDPGVGASGEPFAESFSATINFIYNTPFDVWFELMANAAAMQIGDVFVTYAKVDLSATMEVTWVELPGEATLFTTESGHPYPTAPPSAGNIDGDSDVDLADAILGFQVITGTQPFIMVNREAAINNDEKIGLEEVIYVLQKVSGLR
jgi:hypothetical protein